MAHASSVVKQIEDQLYTGESLLALAEAFELNPLTLSKQLLSRVSYSRKEVATIFQTWAELGPEKRKELLSHHSHQYLIQDVFEQGQDCSDRFDCAAMAEAFKHKVERTLAGLEVRTSEFFSLSIFTRKQSGVPDFRIMSKFVVDGVQMRWVRCNPFVGGVSRLLDAASRAEAREFQRKYGAGLFIYKHGYTTSLKDRMGRTTSVAKLSDLSNLFRLQELGLEEAL